LWGWVGFFEAFDDPGAVAALFETACDWTKAHGATTVVGPASFTTNDEIGLLVKGFEYPPLMLTTHNPPYYERLWVDWGWQPAMDLWGWRGSKGPTVLSDRQRRALERIRERSEGTIRSMKMADFDAEIGRLFEVYNAAWSENWGFAPMPEAEIRHLAKQLKQIIDPELALVIEDRKGEPMAVAIVLLDVNEIMAKIRSGRLAPIGWYRLLRGLQKVHQARVFAVGVRPEKQNLALGPLLYQEMIDRLSAKPNIEWAEASWVLATNDRMNRAIAATGSTHYKTWRLYQRDL
jgi:ribosomal protein S18 acetylase RimI-like enzyme